MDDFGATPSLPGGPSSAAADDDAGDIQEALLKAIEEINLSAQSVTVQFTPGATYHLRAPLGVAPNINSASLIFGTDHFLEIYNCNPSADPGLTLSISGGGARLVAVSPDGGGGHIDLHETLRIGDSNGIVIDSLDFDVPPLSRITGIVTRNLSTSAWTAGLPNTDEFGLLISEGAHSVASMTPFCGAIPAGVDSQFGFWIDDAVDGRPEAGKPNTFKLESIRPVPSSTPPSNRVLMKPCSNAPLDLFEEGDRVAFIRRSGNTITTVRSNRVRFSNLACYGSNEFFCTAKDCTDYRAESCFIGIDPDNPSRAFSINGDGFHLTECQDVSIQNCYFEGLSDDSIHLKQVDRFSVTGCIFTNAKRHAVNLDGDTQPDLSTDGVILGNRADGLGGTFFYHRGGEYSTVDLCDTSSSSSTPPTANWVNDLHLSETGDTAWAVSISPEDDPTLTLQPGDLDFPCKVSVGAPTEALWDWVHLRSNYPTGRSLIAARADQCAGADS
ncbi:MAG: right-handed parallel beta-helix repeat-containing protein, partial [Planctomycetota bacterium]